VARRGVKSKALSVEEKAFNKWLRAERVVVEHVFGRLKKYGIMA
jgi:hypothetical protein